MRRESTGILKKVPSSDWAVIVPKKDRKIGICGDYKVSVNLC